MARIDVHGLTKTYGSVHALDSISFSALPGRVTGLLGPNGSGKSTAMRLMLGLDIGTGTTLFDGVAYRDLDRPSRRIGSLLDPNAFHPGRTARNHLRMIAAGLGLPARVCDEVLNRVGLAAVAHRRAGTYSMGMRQRLGLAGALIGTPDTLILDEPTNGLDPQGMVWLRELLRDFVAAGNTLLLSSHVLPDLQEVVDDVIVIGAGRLLASGSLSHFLDAHGRQHIVVRCDDPGRFAQILAGLGQVAPLGHGRVSVRGPSLEVIGAVARDHGVTLYELYAESSGLEQAYLAVSNQHPLPPVVAAPVTGVPA